MTYGKEPFDLRLTMLCMCRRLPVILSVTLLGTVLFGGGYYVKNVLLRGQCYYTAASVYRVAYAVEEKDVGAVYINQTSWNTYLQSQMFLDAVYVHLRESLEDKADMIYEIPERQVLGEMLQAFLDWALSWKKLSGTVWGGLFLDSSDGKPRWGGSQPIWGRRAKKHTSPEAGKGTVWEGCKVLESKCQGS